MRTPAALADKNPRFDARLELVHRVEQRGEFPHARIRALSDDERQVGVAAVAQFVDRRAVGGDDVNFAVLLPHAVRRALDNLDHNLVRVELAHARLLDERFGFEARSGGGHVKNGSELFGLMPAIDKSAIRSYERRPTR